MRPRLAGGILLCLALAAPPAARAEPPAVLVIGHSPDGVPLGGLIADVSADLERRGLNAIDPTEAAAKLPESSRTDAIAAARRSIEEGERAYLDLDLAKASASLREAIARLDATPGTQAAAALAMALERSALVSLASSKPDDAAAALDRLYRLDPAHKPDATLVSPRFAPAFDEAAKRARAAELRAFRLVTSPDGAELYVDGRAAGVSPASVSISEGMHRFEARLAGFRPSVESKEAHAGVSDIAVRLEAALDEEARAAALRESIEGGVLPAKRERFVADLSPRVGAGAALVLTVRRGAAPSADLYRASQSAVSLDRVDGASSAEVASTVGAWVERRLRPAPIAPAPVRPPVAKSSKRRPWIWIAAGAAVTAAAGAAYATSSTGSERTEVEDGHKTVRFGGPAG